MVPMTVEETADHRHKLAGQAEGGDTRGDRAHHEDDHQLLTLISNRSQDKYSREAGIL